jgi:hypothetical protein
MRCLTSVHTIAHSSLRSGLQFLHRDSRVTVQYLDVVDPGSADFCSGLILVGQIVVPLGSLQDSPSFAPGGATNSIVNVH